MTLKIWYKNREHNVQNIKIRSLELKNKFRSYNAVWNKLSSFICILNKNTKTKNIVILNSA